MTVTYKLSLRLKLQPWVIPTVKVYAKILKLIGREVPDSHIYWLIDRGIRKQDGTKWVRL